MSLIRYYPSVKRLQRIISRLVGPALIAIAGVVVVACSAKPVMTTTPAIYSEYQLEYMVLANYPNVFWSDPDLYPVARVGQELQNALQQFVSIRANDVEFSAILEHLGLDRKDNYTDEERLLIYRQHKLLTLAVQMSPAASGSYHFVLRIGEGQGERLEGTITASGKITVEKREPSFNTHPICLTRGTLIATESGPVPIEEIVVGTPVWTVDPMGKRIAVPVLETTSVAVSDSYRAISLVLRDGRKITASPGHPSAEGKRLDQYKVGDALDGSEVVQASLVAYDGSRTYDVLPGGGTGIYWANGIMLKSTISPH